MRIHRSIALAGRVFALAALALPLPISAQTYSSLVQDLRDRELAQVSERILGVAGRMPADLYGFRAAPEIRSFAEELHHAADVNFRLCGLASGAGAASADAGEARSTAKRDVIARLRRSLVLCDEALAGLTDETALEPTTGPYHRGSHAVAMLGHTWTVYGKLAVMTRLNGIAPTGG